MAKKKLSERNSLGSLVKGDTQMIEMVILLKGHGHLEAAEYTREMLEEAEAFNRKMQARFDRIKEVWAEVEAIQAGKGSKERLQEVVDEFKLEF